MIEEEYISFETAKLAKEKGLDILCDIGYYIDSGVVDYIRDDYKNMFYPRPTQSLLARWLRDKHKLFIEITIDFMRLIIEDNPTKYYTIYYYKIINLKNSSCINNRHEYYSYEKALEAGLQEALNLLS